MQAGRKAEMLTGR
jgi:hypothetical protein